MIQINLLPVREERRKAGVRQLAVVLVGSLVGSLVLVGAFHWKLRSDIRSAQAEVAETQREIDGYKEQLAQVERFKATKQKIETKLGVIERLERSRTGPVRVMDELATHAPERLWLTSLQARGTRLEIEGKSLDNELVAVFLTSLGESPSFENVELQETNAVEEDGLRLNEFTLTAAMVSPSAAPAKAAASGSGVTAVAGR